MRVLWILLLIALLALVPACLKASSRTVLKKDGSGTYVQVSTLEMEKAEAYQKMLLAKAHSLAIPDDEQEENPYASLDAKARARELEDRRGIKSATGGESSDGAKKTRTYDLRVEFESLKAFYESGVLEDVTVKLERAKDGKSWTLTTRHIFDGNDNVPQEGAAADKLRKVREALLKAVEPYWSTLTIQSELTLPSKVLETNGTKGADGRTVTWKLGFGQLADPKNLMQTVMFEHVEGLKLEAFELTANDIENAREAFEMEREEKRK